MSHITSNKSIQKLVVICLLSICSSLLICSPLAAKEIAGIQIAEQVTLSDNTKLNLNGAGIRTKFFFDIYIGALYVKTQSRSEQALIANNDANRIFMHFLYDGVSKEKITNAWTEGFENNNSKQEINDLKQPLNNFNTLFSEAKKGDVILLDYIPQTGTEVRINGTLKGTIPGEIFNQALRKVWLGNEPVDSDLKEAMIGASTDD
jgi:hypothetical protein